MEQTPPEQNAMTRGSNIRSGKSKVGATDGHDNPNRHDSLIQSAKESFVSFVACRELVNNSS